MLLISYCRRAVKKMHCDNKIIEDNMTTKVIIIFPYGGFSENPEKERLFWKIVDLSLSVDSKPIVVINRDTENKSEADAFLNNIKTDQLELKKTWSVDTCQMWLSGWGHVIDKHGNADRVILLPGDIERIRDESHFFAALKQFINTAQLDIVVGDFVSDSKNTSKELIDTYGTYPLLANWFDAVSRAINDLPLAKPRTEFLNIKLPVLKELLKFRKFAYEQTISIFIRAWNFEKNKWKYNIGVSLLGEFHDDKSLRQYRVALDQIERSERLIKLLWREIHEPDPVDKGPMDRKIYQEFIDQYHSLDQKSSAIRESARITVRSLLSV